MKKEGQGRSAAGGKPQIREPGNRRTNGQTDAEASEDRRDDPDASRDGEQLAARKELGYAFMIELLGISMEELMESRPRRQSHYPQPQTQHQPRDGHFGRATTHCWSCLQPDPHQTAPGKGSKDFLWTTRLLGLGHREPIEGGDRGVAVFHAHLGIKAQGVSFRSAFGNA